MIIKNGTLVKKDIMNLKTVLILILAVVSISFAAIFVRFCYDTPPIIIATYRLSFASVIILILFKTKGYSINKISKRDLKLSIISGIFLSLHFYTWFTSIKLTSIASSVVLVTTSPIFVGIFSYLFLKEKQSANIVLGITLSILGSAILALGDFNSSDISNFSKSALIGDMFAVLGSISAAVYIMLGSKVRSNLDIIPYITITYTTSAITLIIASFITNQSFFGYSKISYLNMFLLAVIPQLIGHTSLNWALKHIKSSMVAITTLGEPIGSSILAYIIFRETIDKFQFIGIILIFTAIIIAAKKGAK